MLASTNQTVPLAYRLLFDALVEIRMSAHDSGNKVAFHLADLFHGTALDLGLAAEGRLESEEVVRRLETRAAEKGLARWLNGAISRAGSMSNPSLEPTPTAD